MSTFQIVIIAVFIFLAIIGVVIFAGFGGINQTSTPTAVIWGTARAQDVGELIRNINAKSTVIDVSYVEKDPTTFDTEYITALAKGNGPDVVLISDDLFYKEKDTLIPIGYKTFPEREFKDTFIDEAQHFLTTDGIVAIPFSVDPLVMYWNKDIFAASGVAKAPASWADLSVIAPAIIQRSDTSTILQALVPFGGYSNVTNAKQILATLFFQAGNAITVQDPNTNSTYSVLDQNGTGAIVTPSEAVLSFYTDFSNPLKPLYTWNRAQLLSKDAFLAGDLALYFGYASELQELQSKNPNLNFDVALIPQESQTYKATYGKLTAFGIVKGAKNLRDALTVIGTLTSNESIALWSTLTNLPPVRRDLLSEKPKQSYLSVFYDAAIQSKTWFDPDPEKSDVVFRDMIESITTGRDKNTDAISTARQQLDNLLKGDQ